MNSSSIKLFDDDDNLVSDFDETIELVLMGVHGEKYYDVDEELQDTRMIKTINTEEIEEKESEEKEQKTTKKKSDKVTIKDFLPVLFFIIMTIILCIGGYIFLEQFDLTSLLGM